MARPPHLLFVEAPYYAHLAKLLRDGAERAAAAAGATHESVAVPGAFEIPAAIAAAARLAGGKFDGYVALGCVIRGETTHYDHICAETARSLQDLGVRDGLAVGYGILTVENEAQALVRAAPAGANESGGGRDKGGEAVRACLALVALQRRFAGERA
jgi:6,7-dimethyl-8-ribityllumazine synthase